MAENKQMTETVIVINSGSTSLKFAAYSPDHNGHLKVISHGEFDEMLSAPHFIAHDAAGRVLEERNFSQKELSHQEALAFLIPKLEEEIPGMKIVAAGHRMVLGGTRFEAPVIITEEVLDYLGTLSKIEPSHQPYNVAGARAFARAFPGLPQVACFDTSFHRTMPELAQKYAVSDEITEKGIIHWGFHGISYEYIAGRVRQELPLARRVIACHLGGGASLCAMLDGKSMETSMQFGAVTGIPMATRSGDFPADAIFYLLREGIFDAPALENILYKKSGLLGLSGVSEDMRSLEESRDPKAAKATESFVYGLIKYIGAYTAVLGGLDALIFTAGIGEHSAKVRALVCQKLASFGILLDEKANLQNGPQISTAESKVAVWVIPTDEEVMIARHICELLKF